MARDDVHQEHPSAKTGVLLHCMTCVADSASEADALYTVATRILDRLHRDDSG